MYKYVRRPLFYSGEDADFSFEQTHAELASDIREYTLDDNELTPQERARVTILSLSAARVSKPSPVFGPVSESTEPARTPKQATERSPVPDRAGAAASLPDTPRLHSAEGKTPQKKKRAELTAPAETTTNKNASPPTADPAETPKKKSKPRSPAKRDT